MASIPTATVESPLTPALRQLIAGDVAKVRRILGIVSGGVVALLAIIGIAGGVLAMIPIGVLIGAFVYLLAWLIVRFTMSRDLKDAAFLRTTGPIRVTSSYDPDNGTTYTLVLTDHRFRISHKIASAAGKLSSGTVEYTKHGHIVFDIRDSSGQSVYRHPGYVPEN